MESLRERQKSVRRKQVLDAARELFEEHGYSKTNIAEISDRAAVGVATIYTYFGNKEGVLAELFRAMTDSAIAEVDQLLDNLPNTADELIMSILRTYEKGLTSTEFMKIVLRQSVESGPAKEAMDECRVRQLGQMKEALRKSQAAGSLSQDLDIETAAQIVLGMHFYYIGAIVRGTYTLDAALLTEEKSINVILGNWRAD